jgi:hypothetical protein
LVLIEQPLLSFLLINYIHTESDLLFITTNYKHFIELGNYLGIRIERIETEKQRDRRESDKIMKEFFWRPKKNFKGFK